MREIVAVPRPEERSRAQNEVSWRSEKMPFHLDLARAVGARRTGGRLLVEGRARSAENQVARESDERDPSAIGLLAQSDRPESIGLEAEVFFFRRFVHANVTGGIDDRPRLDRIQ